MASHKPLAANTAVVVGAQAARHVVRLVTIPHGRWGGLGSSHRWQQPGLHLQQAQYSALATRGARRLMNAPCFVGPKPPQGVQATSCSGFHPPLPALHTHTPEPLSTLHYPPTTAPSPEPLPMCRVSRTSTSHRMAPGLCRWATTSSSGCGTRRPGRWEVDTAYVIIFFVFIIHIIIFTTIIAIIIASIIITAIITIIISLCQYMLYSNAAPDQPMVGGFCTRPPC